MTERQLASALLIADRSLRLAKIAHARNASETTSNKLAQARKAKAEACRKLAGSFE